MVHLTKVKNKINSKSLKISLEWSYRILKISKTTSFSSDGLPTIRPTNARRVGPVLSIRKALLSLTETCCLKKIYPLRYHSSFEVQSSSRMVRNNKLITAACTWIINVSAVYYLTCSCYACIIMLYPSRCETTTRQRNVYLNFLRGKIFVESSVWAA